MDGHPAAQAPGRPRPAAERPPATAGGGRGVAPGAGPPPDVPSAPAGFELLIEERPPGLVRRFFTTQRHLAGLIGGALVATVRDTDHRRGLTFRLAQVAALGVRPFVRRALRRQPFPVQLRRRLEILGPTYIKLGQVLSLRRDLLPEAVTTELGNLLDRLPVVPFPRYLELVTESLGRPLGMMFERVDEQPLGSATIAQIHRAVTVEGDEVILKVVKPGIRETLRRDAVLLKMAGSVLQIFFGRFQPRRVIAEFVDYTNREVDLRLEADNAETFAANFTDLPDVVFPRIYRRYSSRDVLCMEFFDGVKPGSEAALARPEEERDRLVDLGAAAIIRMLYQDGFFHADLHPGNLLILPGPKAGFIDLGMVGRFDDALRRSLLYYYFSLVTGDADGAARYLAAVAQMGPGSDPVGFRRHVADISVRWQHRANFADFSLAQLILESVSAAAQFRLYFPVELVLMVKALVTFEGVGQMLKPGLDVAAVSRTHVNHVFLHQFSPGRLARDGLRGGPELVEALVKAPQLITEGLRVLEQSTRRPPENPFTGIRGTLLAGFFLLAAALMAGNGLWWWAGGAALVGLALALRPGR